MTEPTNPTPQQPAPQPTPRQPTRPGEELTDIAVTALTTAAATTRPGPDGRGHPIDAAELVCRVITTVATNLGGIEQLLAGWLGSWEADLIRQIVSGPADLLARLVDKSLVVADAVESPACSAPPAEALADAFCAAVNAARDTHRAGLHHQTATRAAVAAGAEVVVPQVPEPKWHRFAADDPMRHLGRLCSGTAPGGRDRARVRPPAAARGQPADVCGVRARPAAVPAGVTI